MKINILLTKHKSQDQDGRRLTCISWCGQTQYQQSYFLNILHSPTLLKLYCRGGLFNTSSIIIQVALSTGESLPGSLGPWGVLETRQSVFMCRFGLKIWCSIGCFICLLKNVLILEVGDCSHGDCTHGEVAIFLMVDGVWLCMGLLRW